MLEQVLTHLRNRFECDRRYGAFEVSGGMLVVDDLQEGQYFWVMGSVFNDGLHRYRDETMTDEKFEGTVIFCAIPNAVVDLADEIEDWCEANSEVLDSPFQSESFDGYSYSKAGGGSASGDASVTWQSHFRSRLNAYRKLSW